MSDISKAELLEALGYALPHDLQLAALVDAGLTNLRKPRISLAKRERVEEVLRQRFVRVCNRGDCQARAGREAPGRVPVGATGSAKCELCGGSAAAAALRAMQAACARAGWTKLCIVGGSPKAWAEIRKTVPPPLEVVLVDGTIARTLGEARDDLVWADHVVVWGGTQLGHKVSRLYQSAPHCTTVAKRSIQELWAHVAEAARRSG